ncbi:hypothetical protein [Clostridium sp.]
MIWSFRYVEADEISISKEKREAEWNRYKEGMELFSEYLGNLWD